MRARKRNDHLVCHILAVFMIIALNPAGTIYAQVKAPEFSKEPFLLGVPLDLLVPKAPAAFQGSDGKGHVIYELHITNFGPSELLVERVAVRDPSTSTILANYSGEDLHKRVFRPGVFRPGDNPKLSGKARGHAVWQFTIPAGKSTGEILPVASRMIVFIVLDFADPETPARLQHSVVARAPGFAKQGEKTVVGAEVAVGRSALSIGAPLQAGPWWAGNGPSNDSGHRRAAIAVEGSAHIAERLATDWAKGGDDGQLFKGDKSKNSNYYGYGAQVLAVADGTVASLKDGIPENIPAANTTAVPMDLDTVAGNYIILKIGPSVYAFYAHLQPGSLRVKIGDTVHKGDVIALVGNSGNSEGPHLHFHIADSDSPLASEGIPFALDSFQLLGNVVGDEFIPLGAPKLCEHELPLENNVVIFP